MRKVKVINFETFEPSDLCNSDFYSLIERYELLNRTKLAAEKEIKTIKAKIDSYVDVNGKQNYKGDKFIQISDNKFFKREARKKYEIIPSVAESVLKKYGIYQDVITYEPVFNLETLDNYIAMGRIPTEEAKKIFKEKVDYASKFVKAGEIDEV